MNTAIDHPSHIPGQWIKRRVLHFFGRPLRRIERDRYRHPDSRNTDTDIRQTMVYSRHTHHDPNQVAMQDGLEAWARHAAASNGFGDF